MVLGVEAGGSHRVTPGDVQSCSRFRGSLFNPVMWGLCLKVLGFTRPSWQRGRWEGVNVVLGAEHNKVWHLTQNQLSNVPRS